MDLTVFQCAPHWHLQRGKLGSKPNKQQISGVLMPTSGMDTPSPWRQGPNCEASTITAMENAQNGERKRKMKRKQKQTLRKTKREALLSEL